MALIYSLISVLLFLGMLIFLFFPRFVMYLIIIIILLSPFPLPPPPFLLLLPPSSLLPLCHTIQHPTNSYPSPPTATSLAICMPSISSTSISSAAHSPTPVLWWCRSVRRGFIAIMCRVEARRIMGRYLREVVDGNRGRGGRDGGWDG